MSILSAATSDNSGGVGAKGGDILTYSDAEGKQAELQIKEGIYIKLARNFEAKAAELRQQAIAYREYANQLHEQQIQIWQEVE